MTPPPLERIVGEAEGADLSTLIALRALVARDDGARDVGRAEWLTQTAEEIHRWYGNGNGDVPAFPAAETEAYLDEHVVRRLCDQGAILTLADEDGDGSAPEGGARWAAVRLTPAAMAEVERGGRSAVLDRLDATIRAILAGADADRSAAAAVLEEAPVDAPMAEVEAAPAEPASSQPEHRDRTPTVVPGGLTLKASGLVKTYRKRRVVNEVDLHVAQGEIVGLLGPNGAGKTTSFYMMVGLINPDRGRVFIGPRELTGVPMYRRARAGIGYLSQEPSIFRKLTVEENVMAILQTLGLSKAERKQRLETLLDELSIKHLRKTRAYALSGGERRRLEITRALVGNPKFMLLDEPFAGVDPIAVHDIQQIVSDLRRRGIGVLISDHNVEQTLDIVDRAYIMYEGRVRVSGTVSELVWNDEAADIYLGPTLTARMRERYPNPYVDDGGGTEVAEDGDGGPEGPEDGYAPRVRMFDPAADGYDDDVLRRGAGDHHGTPNPQQDEAV